MSRSNGSQYATSAEFSNLGSGRGRNRKFVAAAVLVIAALMMAACSSGPDSNLQTAPAKQHSEKPSSISNPHLPASTASTQQKVLNVWLAADQSLYTYMDEAPAPLRADLVAGQTTADLFPKLAEYYVNPALQSEGIFLLKLKTQLLNGPTTYNLGTPTVTALTATTATVTFCTTDSGTTTVGGKSGPITLDGGAGGSRGTTTLQLTDGSWKIASGQSTGVAKC